MRRIYSTQMNSANEESGTALDNFATGNGARDCHDR